jgi:hypothetical protein
MNARTDPVLSADFAERVLVRALGIAAQRRRARIVLAGVAGLFLVSVAVASWVVMSGAWQSPAPQPAVQSAALPAATVEAQADETDALSAFFPDAESVAGFATDYSAATRETGTALLSDEDTSS